MAASLIAKKKNDRVAYHLIINSILYHLKSAIHNLHTDGKKMSHTLLGKYNINCLDGQNHWRGRGGQHNLLVSREHFYKTINFITEPIFKNFKNVSSSQKNSQTLSQIFMYYYRAIRSIT